MTISLSLSNIPVRFTTRFYGSAKLGVGKYEEALFDELATLTPVELAPIQPLPIPEWMAVAGMHIGRDLRAVAKNIPLYIPPGKDGNGLVHLSNEVIAASLLFHRGPSVITVHHLPPVWSRDFRRETGALLSVYLLALLALHRAKRIIVDSHWSGQQVSQRIRIPKDRIDVIPLGIDSNVFYPAEDAARLVQKYGLGPGPYILYVGSFAVRKNVSSLLAAFAELRRQIPSAELLLAGPIQDAPAAFQVQAQQLDGCRCLGYVPIDDLRCLYSLATIFVMPSKLEGFGFPVLEAMACGAPVIAATGTALPELVEGVGRVFDPDDVHELARHIIDICSDREAQRTMSQCSLNRAKEYSWRRTAELTIASYRRVFERA